ncbi:MAG: cytochrome c maturation protein CcmE [Limnochordaceae bacterium]|nr:cytochrome c maturation protein CcmE [Limnochordaceae bacterium]
MKGRTRIWIGAAVMLAATLYLMVTGFRQTATYYLSVGEAIASVQSSGEPIPVRIRGQVREGTLQVDPVGLVVRFQLEQAPGDGGPAVQAAAAASQALHVTYRGARPDNLGEGQQVIVEGRLSPGGELSATQLLVTCPSRYEAAPDGQEGR